MDRNPRESFLYLLTDLSSRPRLSGKSVLKTYAGSQSRGRHLILSFLLCRAVLELAES